MPPTAHTPQQTRSPTRSATAAAVSPSRQSTSHSPVCSGSPARHHRPASERLRPRRRCTDHPVCYQPSARERRARRGRHRRLCLRRLIRHNRLVHLHDQRRPRRSRRRDSPRHTRRCARGHRPGTIDQLLNDSDPDGDALTILSVTSPAHGSAVLDADGTVGYASDGSYATTDSFTYTISDGRGGLAVATVHVTLAAVLGVTGPA